MSSEHDLSSPVSRRKSRWLTWLAILAIPIIVVIFALSTVFSRVQRLNAVADKLPGAIKKARTAGLAITNEDMNGGATKTSQYFLDAVVEFELQRKRAVFGSRKYFQLRDEKGVFAGPGLDRGLDAMSKTLAIMDDYLKEKQGAIVLEWDMVDGIPGVWAETIETVAKAHCVRGYRSIKSGDWPSGEKEFETVKKLAARVNTWPSSDGFLLANNCVARLKETILQLASEYSTDVNVLERLRKQAVNVIDLVSPLPAVRGEIFYDVSNIRNIRRKVAHGRAYKTVGKEPTPSSLLNHGDIPDDTRVRGALTLFIEETLPIWERVKSEPSCLPKIGKEWDAVKDKLLSKNDILALLGGAQQNPFTIVNRAVWSRLELAQTAMMIDCMIYRSDHGSWPHKSSDLKGHYLDPFSMKDLLLRRAPNGYRIYRVGDNGKDDGGDTAVEAMGTKKVTDDLVVIDIRQPAP